jgi:hypothetical protein
MPTTAAMEAVSIRSRMDSGIHIILKKELELNTMKKIKIFLANGLVIIKADIFSVKCKWYGSDLPILT